MTLGFEAICERLHALGVRGMRGMSWAEARRGATRDDGLRLHVAATEAQATWVARLLSPSVDVRDEGDVGHLDRLREECSRLGDDVDREDAISVAETMMRAEALAMIDAARSGGTGPDHAVAEAVAAARSAPPGVEGTREVVGHLVRAAAAARGTDAGDAGIAARVRDRATVAVSGTVVTVDFGAAPEAVGFAEALAGSPRGRDETYPSGDQAMAAAMPWLDGLRSSVPGGPSARILDGDASARILWGHDRALAAAVVFRDPGNPARLVRLVFDSAGGAASAPRRDGDTRGGTPGQGRVEP